MQLFDVGIDYSINSPAVTIAKVGDYNPKNCWFFYRQVKRKNEVDPAKNFCGFKKPDWSCSAERYQANWLFLEASLKTCGLDKIRHIWIEGYSFGSRGAIFDLAENKGFMSAGLWHYKLQAIPIAPPTIKKHATGSGRAEKTDMYEHWLKQGGLDMAKYWGQAEDANPISDIVDSYFVLRTGVSKLKK